MKYGLIDANKTALPIDRMRGLLRVSVGGYYARAIVARPAGGRATPWFCAPMTAIYVTHDQEEALAISDRVIVMNAGRIAQAGGPRDL